MQNLKNKVFSIIALILSVFSISVLIAFNYQDYAREKNIIQNNLQRIEDGPMRGEFFKEEQDFLEKPDRPQENDVKSQERIDDMRQKIFMDSLIYTVIFDESNNITEIISHTEDKNISEEIPNELRDRLNSVM